MARVTNRFGTLIGWNNITVNVLGRDVEGIEAVSYDDEQEIDVAHGAGGMPIGKTKANYKAKASISIIMEEAISIQQALPKGTRMQDLPDTDIIVQYEYQGSLYKDIIRNVSFKTNGVDVKQGDGKITRKFDLVPVSVDWNV